MSSPRTSRSIIQKKYYERKLYKIYRFSGAQFLKDVSVKIGITGALIEEDLSKLMYLADCGINLNFFDCQGNGPFHYAVGRNNAAILDYLCRDTKFINQQNFQGETALFLAVAQQKYNLAEKLILAGAKVDIPNNSYVTPLHLAVHEPKFARQLIEHGANLNQCDLFNQTPLHCAVDFHCLETVCMLLYYNADVSFTNLKNYTPFMIALERRNVEIQEALFEYVDDYDDITTYDNSYSVLGLALIYDSPFVEEIINRGADVNNVNSYVNGAFFITLHYSRLRSSINVNSFRLVWEKMDYEPVEKISVLGSLFLLQREVFREIVDIFINSKNFSVIAESVTKADDFSSFAIKCIEHHLPLEKFNVISCKLLSYGYTPNENDLTIIYNRWGYCDMFRILLHMDIRRNSCFCNVDKIPTKLIYDVRMGRRRLLTKLVGVIERESYPMDALMAVNIFRVLDYFVCPPLIKAYFSKQKTDCVTLKMNAMPKIPSLLELARNATRDHIENSFGVTSSSQLYTLINELDIADIYKKILTLETVIYKPVFTEAEFKRYIKILNMTPLRKQVVNPLIESAIKNSVVI